MFDGSLMMTVALRKNTCGVDEYFSQARPTNTMTDNRNHFHLEARYKILIHSHLSFYFVAQITEHIAVIADRKIVMNFVVVSPLSAFAYLGST